MSASVKVVFGAGQVLFHGAYCNNHRTIEKEEGAHFLENVTAMFWLGGAYLQLPPAKKMSLPRISHNPTLSSWSAVVLVNPEAGTVQAKLWIVLATIFLQSIVSIE